jgi:hypothetical protein
MSRKKTDPYEATADLISNAIGTARVFGENPRITRLVASTVGKFAIELDNAPDAGSPGVRLVNYALAQISEQDALFIPKLHASLVELAG